MTSSRTSAFVLMITALFAWACSELPTERDAGAVDATADAKPPWAGGGGGGGGGGDGDGGQTDVSTIVAFSDRAADNILSDGSGAYVDGDCGVLADFNLTDARLDPDANFKGKVKKTCAEGPRTLTFVWDDPDDGGDPKPDRTEGIFMNIDAVETETGTDVPHIGQFNVCNRLIFNPDDPGIPNNGSDLLLVTFDDGGTAGDPSDDLWTVRTQAYPNDKGYCEGDGRLWHMTFELTIRRQ